MLVQSIHKFLLAWIWRSETAANKVDIVIQRVVLQRLFIDDAREYGLNSLGGSKHMTLLRLISNSFHQSLREFSVVNCLIPNRTSNREVSITGFAQRWNSDPWECHSCDLLAFFLFFLSCLLLVLLLVFLLLPCFVRLHHFYDFSTQRLQVK